MREFLMRPAAWSALAFVFLYKLCDALAGSMTAPFVLSLGYDKATYAAIVKGLGLAALVSGGFVGGAIAAALPQAAALGLGGILQMLSMLAFLWLGLRPPSAATLSVAICIENFCAAIGTVMLVAYISAQCGNRRHTASQYALLTGLAAGGRTLLSAGSGFVVAALGWSAFFLVSAAAAVPSLIVLAHLHRRGHFHALGTRQHEPEHRPGTYPTSRAPRRSG
jgi:MFS transporter, PAT family, beta-lactamase induction signal transducer AmpG